MNTTPNFKIDLVSLLDRTPAEVETIVKTNYKCPLKDLKFLDLLTNPVTVSKDRTLRHGVYVFFDQNGNPLYVGMCASSHFARRIGAHFGLSPNYSDNQFLDGMVKKLRTQKERDRERWQVYAHTVREIGDHSLLLVAVNTLPEYITDLQWKRGEERKKRDSTEKEAVIKQLEKIFIRLFNPCLNIQGKRNPYEPDAKLRTIREYLADALKKHQKEQCLKHGERKK
ncbi:hypothetical protein [Candidatus Spongiihabitans sp.]|uniref:hypothetical protein n=1 Tax=Candidatus Spongiihabitans sp. TaxID=3101308 RepID=UPI003C6EB0D1